MNNTRKTTIVNTKEKGGGRFNSSRVTPRIKVTPREAQEHKEDCHEHKREGGVQFIRNKMNNTMKRTNI